jgi:hypothetical protein
MFRQIGHKNGSNLVETGSNNPMPVKPSATDYDWTSASAGPVVNTSNVAFKFAVAGKKIYLTSLQMKNTGATATEVVVKSGANILFRTFLGAGMSVGENIQFPTPLQTVAGDSLTFACITAGASVYVNAQGYVES